MHICASLNRKYTRRDSWQNLTSDYFALEQIKHGSNLFQVSPKNKWQSDCNHREALTSNLPVPCFWCTKHSSFGGQFITECIVWDPAQNGGFLWDSWRSWDSSFFSIRVKCDKREVFFFKLRLSVNLIFNLKVSHLHIDMFIVHSLLTTYGNIFFIHKFIKRL